MVVQANELEDMKGDNNNNNKVLSTMLKLSVEKGVWYFFKQIKKMWAGKAKVFRLERVGDPHYCFLVNEYMKSIFLIKVFV